MSANLHNYAYSLLEQNYSVVLVIPDFYDRAYVRELVTILLVTMGFKQICAQQESVAVGSQMLTVIMPGLDRNH
jgi:hypothetical protein